MYQVKYENSDSRTLLDMAVGTKGGRDQTKCMRRLDVSTTQDYMWSTTASLYQSFMQVKIPVGDAPNWEEKVENEEGLEDTSQRWVSQNYFCLCQIWTSSPNSAAIHYSLRQCMCSSYHPWKIAFTNKFNSKKYLASQCFSEILSQVEESITARNQATPSWTSFYSKMWHWTWATHLQRLFLLWSRIHSPTARR